MNPSVLPEVHLRPERLFAVFALELALARVDPAMNVERKLPGKFLAAKLALVSLLARVDGDEMVVLFIFTF